MTRKPMLHYTQTQEKGFGVLLKGGIKSRECSEKGRLFQRKETQLTSHDPVLVLIPEAFSSGPCLMERCN